MLFLGHVISSRAFISLISLTDTALLFFWDISENHLLTSAHFLADVRLCITRNSTEYERAYHLLYAHVCANYFFGPSSAINEFHWKSQA